MDEERFAHDIREMSSVIGDCERRVMTTEADIKRIVAREMVVAEAAGQKSAVAQQRSADLSDRVYEARIQHGTARGQLAAARVEMKAREIAFETWRSKMASLRIERKVYSA
jgi:ribosome-binding protein aMBF1 (putative translation factor)